MTCRFLSNHKNRKKYLNKSTLRYITQNVSAFGDFCSSPQTRSLLVRLLAWWRHQMETFSALLAIYAGNSPVSGEFFAQRPVTRSFDIFFDLRLNKWLSKQSWGWWFQTLSCPLWRHCNAGLFIILPFNLLQPQALSAATSTYQLYGHRHITI